MYYKKKKKKKKLTNKNRNIGKINFIGLEMISDRCW